MPACAIKPEDRRKQIRLVGNDLVKSYGKKRYYTVREVQHANRRQAIDLDVSCWSHAFFNTRHDFNEHHEKMGEACDYSAMKREMLDSVSSSSDSSWFDFDSSWLEFPDIDWSIFDLS